MTTEGSTPDWEKYEQVAIYLLNRVASALGLEHVEGKQKVIDSRSGMRWEIDGKGVKIGNEGFVVIECRRYTKSKQKPGQMAELAYRIHGIGAEGGILVSPLGVQEGAAKIAACENIQIVNMNENSTNTDYMLSFLNTVFVGASDTGHATEDARVEIIEDPKD
jgi:hypothetical protein